MGPGDLLEKICSKHIFPQIFNSSKKNTRKNFTRKKFTRKSKIGKAQKFRPKSTIITGNYWELERSHFLIKESCNSSFYLSSISPSSISFCELLKKY